MAVRNAVEIENIEPQESEDKGVRYKKAIENAKNQIRQTLEAYKGDGAEKRPGFKYGLRYALSVINDKMEEAAYDERRI